jgi:hypothetical protein
MDPTDSLDTDKEIFLPLPGIGPNFSQPAHSLVTIMTETEGVE